MNTVTNFRVLLPDQRMLLTIVGKHNAGTRHAIVLNSRKNNKMKRADVFSLFLYS